MTTFPRPQPPVSATAYVIVLGVSQDGGVPQVATKDHRGWEEPAYRRRVACLGIVDGQHRWLVDATLDLREQVRVLDQAAPVEATPGLDGIFLTHAHVGHYSGLLHLGHEVLGSRDVPVYAMPRMLQYLSSNGPWEQLVRYRNIDLRPMSPEAPVRLGPGVTVTPFLVPHRQEYSEVVGFRIVGRSRSVLYIPDIDRWEDWDGEGRRIEAEIEMADVAFLDGTFYSRGEIPGRDMSSFPHPFITDTMNRLRLLPSEEKAKVRFIHLNHTNPALWPESKERKEVLENGFRIAEEEEKVEIGLREEWSQSP